MGAIRDLTKECLPRSDPELFRFIQEEKRRQAQTLELIASENYAPLSILQCLSSCYNNKYLKMIHRHYENNIQSLCERRALETFNLDSEDWGVNVSAYSGAIANLAVYMALCNPHDRIMGLEVRDGGHYTHGNMKAKEKLSSTSIFFETFPYKLDQKTGLIDYENLAETARLYSPKIIIAGVSCHSRLLDYKRFRQIADEVGAYLVADIAHIAGLVAASLIPAPFEHCHVVTTSTYKTLRGPKGAIIFYQKGIKLSSRNGNLAEDLETRINKAVFPGIIGSVMANNVAGIATTMKQASSPAFKRYQKQVMVNSKRFCSKLQELGYDIVTGGTDIHMLLLNLKPLGISGPQAEYLLEQVNISCNSHPVPGDKEGFCSNGLRLGTPALTTRGCNENDFDTVVYFLDRALELTIKTSSKSGETLDDFKTTTKEDIEIIEEIKLLKSEISAFCENFPVPGMDEY